MYCIRSMYTSAGANTEQSTPAIPRLDELTRWMAINLTAKVSMDDSVV